MNKYNKEFIPKLDRTVYYHKAYKLVEPQYRQIEAKKLGGNVCADIKYPNAKKITYEKIVNVFGHKVISSLLMRYIINNEKNIDSYADYLNEKYSYDLDKKKIADLFSAD